MAKRWRRGGVAGAALLTLCATIAACSHNDAIDGRLVGRWQTQFGQLTLVFQPRADGHYTTTFAGPHAPSAESGRFEARDGRWKLAADNGRTDAGSYRFITPDTVIIQGRTGALTWVRSKGVASAQGSPASTAVAPLRTSWPPAGVPRLAADVRRTARQWRPDAILTGIATQLLGSGSPVVANVQTPQGAATLAFLFCSPGSGERLVVSPHAPIAETRTAGSGACRVDRAVPDNFTDLPNAVAAARERGMGAGEPSRAELLYVSGVKGEDVVGWAWRIYPPKYSSDQAYLVPLRTAAAPVRTVQACTLVTMRQAQTVLGGPVRSVTPATDEPRTWSCVYQRLGDRRLQISLTVDENPNRDAKGYMANQRRNGHVGVAGLGDEAYLFDSPAGFAQLDVLVGDTLLQFGLSGPDFDRTVAIEGLAKTAVARLAGGGGRTVEAAPEDRLVGTWVARDRDWRLLMTIKPDRAFNLSVAGDLTGTMSAGGGRWTLVTRARRPLADGTYTSRGRDTFETRGIVAGRWRRVNAPTRIAPQLAGRALLDPDQLAHGPWPQAPVDQRLVGLWESAGTISGEPVQLAWRIGEKGPSQLTWVVTGNGYLQPQVVRDRVLLHLSQALQSSARQLGLSLANYATTVIEDQHLGPDQFTMQRVDITTLEWHRVGGQTPVAGR